MARGSDTTRPPTGAELADKCNRIRQLISLADHQLDRAKADLTTARAELADLEQQVQL